MTDVIIVHSMHGNSRNHWYQWLEHNLTLEGYDVTLFNFESPEAKTVDQWIEAMTKQINVRKKDTYFVTRGWLRNIYSVARSDARLHDTIGNVWLLCCVSR